MKKIQAKNVAASVSTYIGKSGELFYDILGEIRISDGLTPGGNPIAVPGSTSVPPKTYAQSTEPVGAVVGSTWYNTSTFESKILTGVSPYVWVTEIPSPVPKSYAQPTEPVNAIVGSTWYNTSTLETKILTGVSPYVWVTEDYPDAPKAYAQSTEPVGAVIGSSWYNTTTSESKILTGVSPYVWVTEIPSPVPKSYAQLTEPVGAVIGSRWYNTTTFESKVLTSVGPNVWTTEFVHGYYTIEDSFVNMTNQLLPGVDLPVTINYGAARNTTNGILGIDATGIVTMLKTGPLMIKTRHRIGRTGSSGVSHVFQWVEISVDGGTNWIINGQSVMTLLSNSDQTSTFFDQSPIYFPAGTKLRSRIARSSTGHNSGDLVAEAPSTILQGIGVTTTPAAQLSVYRLVGWNYQ